MSAGELPENEAARIYELGYQAGWMARELVDAQQLPRVCRPYGLRGRPMFGGKLGRRSR